MATLTTQAHHDALRGHYRSHNHRTRIVLPKRMSSARLSRSISQAARIGELNPYNTVPTLIDRDLVLYDSHIINSAWTSACHTRRSCR